MIAPRLAATLIIAGLLALGPLVSRAQPATPFTAEPPAPDVVATLIGPSRYSLGWTDGHGPAINDDGQVAGVIEAADGSLHAAVWDGFQPIDLGLRSGDGASEAYGINDRGQVVGHSVPIGVFPGRAVLWEEGRLVELGALGGERGLAHDINDVGQVVGYAETAAGDFHAFLWEDGRMTDLGALPGDALSKALAINDAGQIVGYSKSTDDLVRAVVWEHGEIAPLTNLPGDAQSVASDIDRTGRIVGWSGASLRDRAAVVWDDRRPTALTTPSGPSGAIGSQANGLNDAGQIVGESWVMSPYSTSRALLWEEGRIVDLGNVLDGPGSSGAVAINQARQIVGWAELEGEQHLVRWDPPDLGPAPILAPAPTTPRWRLPAGEDSIQLLSIMLAGVFQPRALLVANDLVVVPRQDAPAGLIAVDLRTGQERWRRTVPEARLGLLVATAAARNRVIVTASGGDDVSTVSAIELATGQEAWSVVLAGEAQYPPIVDGDDIYVAAKHLGLLVLDAATGATRWQSPTDADPGPIVVAQTGIVVVGHDDGVAVGFDRATGQERWRRTVAPQLVDAPYGWDWYGDTGNEIVLLKSLDGDPDLTGSTLYALDASTGAERWRRAFDDTVATSPRVIGDAVFVGVGSVVLALDLATGAERWRRDAASAGISWFDPGFVTDGDDVLLMSGVASEDDEFVGVLAAFESADGDPLWAVASADPWLLDTPPWLHDGIMVARGFGDEGVVSAVAYAVPLLARVSTGSGLAKRRGDDIDESSPSAVAAEEQPTATAGPVVDGVAYVIYADQLVAVDVERGEARWRTTLHGRRGFGGIEQAGAIVGDIVAVVDDDGLRAIELTSGREKWRRNGLDPNHDPLGSGGSILAITWKGDVAAFNAATGEEQWSWSGDHEAQGLGATLGLLLVGSLWGDICALDVESGRARWCQKLPGHDVESGGAWVRGVANGIVIAERDDWTYAYDAASGDLLWPEPRENLEGAYLAGETLFGRLSSRRIAAINARTGDVKWRIALPGGYVDQVVAGVAYVGGANGWALTLDARSGAVLSEVDTGQRAVIVESGSGMMTVVAVASGLALVGDDRWDGTGGILFAVDFATESIRWRLDLLAI